MGKGVAVLLGLCLLVLALSLRPGLVVRWLGRQFPDVLFRVETAEPVVALTIDDSPHGTRTLRILDVLAEHGAHATFFAIGGNVAGNEGAVRRIVGEGHELGNHMLADARSSRLSADEFEQQLRQTHQLLATHGPVAWFRPGHGWFTRRMLDQIRSHGYCCALASTYAFEFAAPPARIAAWQILLNTRPGAVIVLHDGADEQERTVAVLRLLLPALEKRGYRVVTLSELVAAASHAVVAEAGGACTTRRALV